MTHRDTGRRALARTALGAGVGHLALGREHMAEWVLWPWSPGSPPSSWEHRGRRRGSRP